MKIGILIIFFNNEKEIDNHLFNSLLRLPKLVRLSLVNNGSTDNTLEKLQELEDSYNADLSLIDIKKNKGTNAALKAGARYLLEKEDLKHIGYLNLESAFNFKKVAEIMILIKENYDLIAPYSVEINNNTPFQRSLFKNMFSMSDWVLDLQHKKLENV
ncbi:glycosyltransferase [uncultured Formosa sp.]|uniref:glycosyltransferase n=1 Tax=uncultured Formosa sp. TaxID=255435 RepID=UPI00262FD35A|nr:glycosyltransferase [uncultured Formosa sp.]